MSELYSDLGNATAYAREKVGPIIWMEIMEDGIRARGSMGGMFAERAVAWVNLEHYRNGALSLLKKTIDEVSDMLAEQS